MLGLQLGDKLGLESACFLGVQVADFLWHIKEGSNGFVVALLWSFLRNASSSTDLNRELLALGVSNKLAGLLLNVLGGTRRLIDGSALLRALTIAHLLQWSVAFLYFFLKSLLLEGDLTFLLKVFLTHFLLS